MDKNNTQELTWDLLRNIIEKSDVHWPNIEINVNTLIPVIRETINQLNEEEHEEYEWNNK